MDQTTKISPVTEVMRLQRRLERERRVRQESENIAEHALSELYARQCEVELLERIAAAANEAGTIDKALKAALDLICRHTNWPVGHAFLRGGTPAFPTLSSAGHWHLSDVEKYASCCKATCSPNPAQRPTWKPFSRSKALKTWFCKKPPKKLKRNSSKNKPKQTIVCS